MVLGRHIEDSVHSNETFCVFDMVADLCLVRTDGFKG